MIQIFKFIWNHPLVAADGRKRAYLRFLNWQISQKLFPTKVLYTVNQKMKLAISRGDTGATGLIYCGLLEFFDMMFVAHLMREKEQFIDIGSNVGVYSVFASTQTGCFSLAIEPVPSTFDKLLLNIKINNLESIVTALNIGVSSDNEKLYFSNDEDTVNHVVNNDSVNTVTVDCLALDSIEVVDSPVCIKIDVEGFETNVIKGGLQVLKGPNLKAIILELNGSGSRYGFNDMDIHNTLIEMGFGSYFYNPFERKLIETDVPGNHNTIYIKDKEWVETRLQQATTVSILNQNI